VARNAHASVARIATRRVQRLDAVEGACDDALPVMCRRPRGPVFIGEGELNFVCRECLAIVCEGIAPGDLAGIAVRCSCGAVGRMPGTAYEPRTLAPHPVAASDRPLAPARAPLTVRYRSS
jgi:hypothetical protein